MGCPGLVDHYTIPLPNMAPKRPLNDSFNGPKRDLTHEARYSETGLAI